MSILLTLAMMNKLYPLTDFEVMHSVHSHVSFARIATCDFVHCRLGLFQVKTREVRVQEFNPAITKRPKKGNHGSHAYHIQLNILFCTLCRRGSASRQEIFLVLGQCGCLETIQQKSRGIGLVKLQNDISTTSNTNKVGIKVSHVDRRVTLYSYCFFAKSSACPYLVICIAGPRGDMDGYSTFIARLSWLFWFSFVFVNETPTTPS